MIAATSQFARDGHLREVTGIDLASDRRVPIVLYQHDQKMPVGSCIAIDVEDDALAARIELAAAGISVVVDQCCAMVKAGVLRGISVGFDPGISAAVPLDPKKPRGGLRFVRSELLEMSVVSVPADPGALVVARSTSARAAFLRRIEALPPIAPANIARAAAIVPWSRSGHILSHAGHVWTLLSSSAKSRTAARRSERAPQSDFGLTARDTASTRQSHAQFIRLRRDSTESRPASRGMAFKPRPVSPDRRVA